MDSFGFLCFQGPGMGPSSCRVCVCVCGCVCVCVCVYERALTQPCRLFVTSWTLQEQFSEHGALSRQLSGRTCEVCSGWGTFERQAVLQ